MCAVWRVGKTSSRRAVIAALPACVGLCRRMDALWHETDPACTRGPVSFGRDGEGWGCVFIGARKPAHTTWTPWLRPHAWGLYRRMTALWHETDPTCTRGVCFVFGGRGGLGWGCFFLGAGKLPHTAWTPWLRPHAWGLCRRMDALRRAKGPAFMRAGRLDGTGRAARLSCPGGLSCRKFPSGLAAGGGCRNVVGNGALGGASACAPGSGACRQ